MYSFTPQVPGANVLLFSRYRVIRELGRGGMGVVVLAHDIDLDIDVAVKLVPDAVVHDAEAIASMRREVLKGMALNHDGIVRTHTFERDAGGAGIVMEFVEGDTLSDLKPKQTDFCFEPEQILGWIEQLCSVLDYAHTEARIVHRDLKPRNIMVTRPRGGRPGRLKVADFGIAAALGDSLSKHSMEGKISGTLSYMSPQQAQGKRPTHLDDIHALGATMYELLTGKPPFFRGDPASIHAQVVCVVPPTMEERREELEVFGKKALPREWEETVAACLAKDPAHRPQTAGQVFARLKNANLNTVRTVRKATVTHSAFPTVPGQTRQATPPSSDVPGTPVSAAPPVAERLAQPPQQSSSMLRSVALVAAGAAVTGWGAYAYLGKINTAPKPTPAPRVELPQATPAAKLYAPAATPQAATPTPRAIVLAPKPTPKPTPLPIVPTRLKPHVNSLGMKFVPAGTHGVYFSVWETRVKDFAAFTRNSNYSVPSGIQVLRVFTLIDGSKRAEWQERSECSWQNPDFQQSQEHPVVGVSIGDARAFCRWLTLKEHQEGLLSLDSVYCLPTDAEWTSAVRGQEYPWGDWPPDDHSGNYLDSYGAQGLVIRGHGKGKRSDWKHLRGVSDGWGDTAPVANFTPNDYGICDLGGNVAEFCDTPYRASLNSGDFLAENPDEADDGHGAFYILRGGDWSVFQEAELRSDVRRKLNPTHRSDHCGFRIVLATEPSSTPALLMRADLRVLRREWAGAIADCTAILRQDPNEARALLIRGNAYASSANYYQAIADLTEANRRFPSDVTVAGNLAWVLATAPDAAVRDGNRAVTLADRICKATNYRSPNDLDTLAAAYAEVGDWSSAVQRQLEALSLLGAQESELRKEFAARLDLYRQRQPYHSK